jgi:hypothetical protein
VRTERQTLDDIARLDAADGLSLTLVGVLGSFFCVSDSLLNLAFHLLDSAFDLHLVAADDFTGLALDLTDGVLCGSCYLILVHRSLSWTK